MPKAYIIGVSALTVLFGALMILMGVQLHQHQHNTAPARGDFTVTFPNSPRYVHPARSI